MNYLLLANVLIWIGVGGYIFFLGIKQGKLDKKIRHLEFMNDK
ncbi:MAG: CcmD family protein [Thermodesulfobacteriota bacterium]